MVSGNKKSKSKIIATPTKTTDQTTAQRQPIPSNKKLQITKTAISLELHQTNLEEQVKKQNELIEKLTKKVVKVVFRAISSIWGGDSLTTNDFN